MVNFCQFGYLPNDNVCSLCLLPNWYAQDLMYSLQCSNNQVTPFWMVADPRGTGVLKDYT